MAVRAAAARGSVRVFVEWQTFGCLCRVRCSHALRADVPAPDREDSPMMPADRCSFEVVYKKDAQGDEAIDHVVVRTGLSDASVTLTIPQVYNLARLLNVVPVIERNVTDRGSASTPTALPRAQAVRVE
jgi:hypothetical protein